MSDLLPWMAPWTGLTLATVLLAAGLYLFWRGLFSDRSHSTPRCPKCWYDRTGLPSATCPECGYAIKKEADAFRTRRSWKLAVFSTVVAFGLPTYAIQNRVREYGWRYYLQLQPMYWLFPTRVLWSRQCNGYLIECLVDQRDRGGEEFDNQRLRIRRAGKTALQHNDGWEWQLGYTDGSIHNGVDVGTDFNGDGVPDIALIEWSGGAHCCYTLYLFELGPTDLKPLAVIKAHHSNPEFTRRNGLVDINLQDWTFAYWNTSFADSPAPSVILSWNGSKYAIDPTAMHAPAPPAKDLNELAAKVRTKLKADEYLWYNSQLWGTMLDLIYTGNAELAYDFLDTTWPVERPGKDQFLADFKKQLNESPYADALDAAYHWR